MDSIILYVVVLIKVIKKHKGLFIGLALFFGVQFAYIFGISRGEVKWWGSPDTEIILVGDVMLGRTVMTKSLDLKDFTYAFSGVSERLNEANVVFANLEAPFVTGCKRDYESLVFCADFKMVEGLKHANIGVVNIANNHTRNYGEAGFEETKKILDENGILYVGDGNLETIRINEYTNVGFLGFDLLTNKLTDEDLELVRKSKEQVDVLIVGVHWGNEYQGVANNVQKEYARKLVEAGVDVISGHHPHWIQNVEKIGEARVYYSLGNFVFDQMWSEETRKGLVVSLKYDKGKLVSEEQLQVYMQNWAQPEWVE